MYENTGLSGAVAADRQEASDEELVDRARGGDQEAFNELITRHRSLCLKRAIQILHNRSDAEDDVQSACGRAFQHLAQFQGKGSFGAWLCRIVENTCLMRIRLQRSTPCVSLDAIRQPNVRLEAVGSGPNPEDELGRRELATLVRKEVAKMPALFRDVLILRDSEQLPIQSVADRLGVSVPAAKSRLMRARGELRSKIGKHCGRKGAGTLLETAAYSGTAYTRAS